MISFTVLRESRFFLRTQASFDWPCWTELWGCLPLLIQEKTFLRLSFSSSACCMSFFVLFLSSARTGILLFRLQINPNFDERYVENGCQDSFQCQPIKYVESCLQFWYTYLFHFVCLRVLQHGLQCCT